MSAAMSTALYSARVGKIRVVGSAGRYVRQCAGGVRVVAGGGAAHPASGIGAAREQRV
jgi:hypothetical protein